MSASDTPTPLTTHRSNNLRGTAAIPGDKSVSHRALIFGAMAIGETVITGLLEGEDVLDTAKAMRALGATVTRDDDGTWRVLGVGTGGFREPYHVIDCGNSGTGCRLIMGAVATHAFSTTPRVLQRSCPPRQHRRLVWRHRPTPERQERQY